MNDEHGILVTRPTGGRIGELEGDGSRPKGGKSGYAKDIMPGRVDAEEASGHAVPIAGSRGAQEGRVPAAQRKTGHYGAVTAGDAEQRMSARLSGKMARIPDGLDSPGRPKGAVMDTPVEQYDDPRMEMHDGAEQAPMHAPAEPLNANQPTAVAMAPVALAAPVAPVIPPAAAGAAAADGTLAVLTGLLSDLVHQKEAHGHGPGQMAPPAPQPITATATDPTPAADMDVSFQTPFGIYTVPAIDVKATQYGVIVILPYARGNATFVPQPGAKLNVGWGEHSVSCMFPGTVFPFQDKGIIIITMLRDERAETETDQEVG